MQKKIIALAVAGLVSGAAFAQTNVTLSGLVDLGLYHQSIQTTGVADTTDFRSNGSATSNLTITVNEDLGGGMKAGFVGSTDWSPGANATTFLNSQNFLSLGGGFGEFRFGNINTAALAASSTSQPFATAIGSGYSGAFARLAAYSINGTGAAVADGETTAAGSAVSGARSVRVNQSMMYVTPKFGGFSASLQLALKNSDSSVATAGNSAGFQGIGLAYNAGPLNVQFANEAYKGSANSGTSGIGVNLNDGQKLKNNLLGANYTFGAATIYGGYTTSKTTGLADNNNSSSWNIAAKYNFTGAIAGMFNYVKVNDKSVGNQDRSLWALGLDYSMSKRTVAYVRYENGDNDKSAAAGSTGDFSRTQVGLRHSF